ncbi:MAG: glycosyltransferase family 39 protein [Clostridia bacterium]|nr:glycosyltransferase family 39 protein [Clostridia bacterium]
MDFFLKEESVKFRIFIFSLLILFFYICAGTSLYYRERLLLGSLEEFNNDDVKYLRSADTLLKTGKFTYEDPEKSTVFIMPGIVLVLLPFVKIFGMAGAVLPFQIFSAFLMTITVYVFFQFAKRQFGNLSASIALVAMISYIPLVYISTLILTETCFLFCFAWLLYFSGIALAEKREKYYIVAGIAWGLATLFRPMIVLFPVVLLILWMQKKSSFHEMKRYATLLVIPFLFLLSPWWIRNAITFQRFIPFTLSMGNPMLLGAFINNEVDFELIERLNQNNLQYTDDFLWNNYVDMEFAKMVTEYHFRQDFWGYLKWILVTKTWLNFTDPYCLPGFYGLPILWLQRQHLFYMLCGLLGMLICLKKKKDSSFLLIFTVFYFALAHLSVLAYSRYMIPVMPVMILLGAEAVTTVVRKVDYS